MSDHVYEREARVLKYLSISKGKAITVQAWMGPEGSKMLRLPAHEDGKVVSCTHWPPLPPRKYSWYSFLLEAESTPTPWCS